MHIHFSKGFYYGISCMNILYFIRLMPSITFSYFSPYSLIFNNFLWVSFCHLHTQMQCISILFTLSSLSLFLYLFVNIYYLFNCSHHSGYDVVSHEFWFISLMTGHVDLFSRAYWTLVYLPLLFFLYHLGHTPSPLVLSVNFQIGSHTFCLGTEIFLPMPPT
jgi:hypothetical protein